ncbi:PREDICTED: T-cell immunoglobulin and mucin domain-containing protein 4 isoform X1 [Pseudopodoces humilis]|uniref:T-cell immunoglobulin and mucin domain-containing protein 4 isoform X1 n=1 Tax=Pseudopodoces humilis TaxID=181119 RepID=UPI0006B838BD|nr:PREDICTED: T-cell immunoglobulin and mucin domain-containing protein 4 isoform X1 [Pseudopodoces humilis]
MRLQWDSLSASGKEKIWFSLLPLAVLVSPSARMSHFVLFHWMMIQIFIAHTVSEAVVRGTTGRPVTLPCSYRVTRRSGISDMCWGRGPCPNSKCSNKILHTAGSKVTFRASQRYNLHGSVSFGDVSLTIGAVKAEDAGIYCCRVEIPGLFNDIKRNIRLEVARAPPVTTTTTTTTKDPVFSKYITETTFAPQATSDLQPTPETAVWLTNSILLPETTAPESPTVTTGEISSPSTVASTENDIFPVTMVETSAPPDFPTTSQAADVMTEDVMFCSTLPGSTEVTSELPGTLPASVITEFPGTLPAAEETTSSVMMEEMSVMEVSANSDGSAGKHEDRRDKFPSSAILIACVIGGSSLLILMISLVWKRKQAKKFTVKSVGPPEETDKVFSGAEGENNIFSL